MANNALGEKVVRVVARVSFYQIAFRLLMLVICFIGVSLMAEQKAYALDGEYTFGGGVNTDFSVSSDIYGVGGWFFFQYCIQEGFHINTSISAGAGFDTHAQEVQVFDIYALRAGGVYALDILEWVPYVGLNGVFYATSREDYFSLGQVAVGVDLSIGLDYRRWLDASIGFEFSYHLVFTDRKTLPDFFGIALYYAWQSDPF